MSKTYVYTHIALLITIYILDYAFEFNESDSQHRTLEKDDFLVLYNPVYNETTSFPCKQLQYDVLSQLPQGYTFIDYVYKIHDSSLFTFHRDVTSSKSVFKTKYPVYTLILYKRDGCMLSVCPGSARSYPFVWSHIVNIHGKPGTAFLFDSDLLHAGCLNQCKARETIQYKLCHASDLPLLSSLTGVRKAKRDTCSDSLTNQFLRKISYYFEFPINYFFSPFMMKKHDPNSITGVVQSMVPLGFYNNA